MKIVYLHGLESKTNCAKVKFLREMGHTVYNPGIDYRNLNSDQFESIYSAIKTFNPNLVIGSSMGGYFAYNVGKRFGIQVLLLNPALHSRGFDPEISTHDGIIPRATVLLGENDDIINPEDTIEMIKSDRDILSHEIIIKSHGHRTPVSAIDSIFN